MSKKVSPEARVIEYFETASVEMANVMLGIVKARVKARTPAAAAKVAKRVRKPNAKPTTGSSPQTSFDPATLAQ